MRNAFGQTAAAPYSLRPSKGATVSTPLEWKEVKKGLDPKDFNIKSIFGRLKKKGDIWKPVLGKEKFEMLAFAVSVVNGCESCVVSHENVLRAAELSAEKIHDLARMASVVRALKTLSEVGG